MAYHLGVGVAGGILDQRLYGVSMLVSEGGDCGGSRIALLPNLMQHKKFFFYIIFFKIFISKTPKEI